MADGPRAMDFLVQDDVGYGAGTALRCSVPVYASGVGPRDVVSHVGRSSEGGHVAVGLRVGSWVETERTNLQAARRELGEEAGR
jgi:8-oxo-dGTP pyrophosphatase MutT (NUDIX family)